MSGFPDDSDNDAPADELADAYRKARSFEYPMFANAPVLEMRAANREWAIISLVDLQSAAAFGRKPGES